MAVTTPASVMPAMTTNRPASSIRVKKSISLIASVKVSLGFPDLNSFADEADAQQDQADQAVGDSGLFGDEGGQDQQHDGADQQDGGEVIRHDSLLI